MRNTVTNGRIRIFDLLDEDSHELRDWEFRDVTLVGPAILLFVGRVGFEGGSINHGGLGIEAALWDIPEGKPGALGVIGLVDCDFYNCKFEDIGFMGRPDQLNGWAQSMTVEDVTGNA